MRRRCPDRHGRLGPSLALHGALQPHSCQDNLMVGSLFALESHVFLVPVKVARAPRGNGEQDKQAVQNALARARRRFRSLVEQEKIGPAPKTIVGLGWGGVCRGGRTTPSRVPERRKNGVKQRLRTPSEGVKMASILRPPKAIQGVIGSYSFTVYDVTLWMPVCSTNVPRRIGQMPPRTAHSFGSPPDARR